MPYKRRYRKKKGAYALAKRALKKVNKISKRVELKQNQKDITALAINWDGAILGFNLNDVTQGIGDSNRIGDRITNTSLYLGIDAFRGLDDCTVRCIAFWDKQNTITAVNQILDFVGTPIAVVSDYHVDKRHEWTKVWDKVFTLSQFDVNIRQMRKRFKVNKLTQFNASTTVINTGALKLLYITDLANGLPLTEYPIINGMSRFYFSDL